MQSAGLTSAPPVSRVGTTESARDRGVQRDTLMRWSLVRNGAKRTSEDYDTLSLSLSAYVDLFLCKDFRCNAFMSLSLHCGVNQCFHSLSLARFFNAHITTFPRFPISQLPLSIRTNLESTNCFACHVTHTTSPMYNISLLNSLSINRVPCVILVKIDVEFLTHPNHKMQCKCAIMSA